MKFLIISALLSATLLVASSPVDSDLERANAAKWESFKSAHGKKYAPGEELVRKSKFLAVDALIQANNQNPNSTFVMAHNKFSDLTDGEKQALLGAVPPPIDDRTLPEEVEFERAPTSLDLRGKCLGPVKNQGSCGSCWTFSATSPLEWSYCNKYGSYVSISEQQIVSCATDAGGGCNGGWPNKVYEYYMSSSVGGAVPTSAWPYTSGSNGKNGVCTFDKTKVKVKVASYGYISSSPTSIINALNQYGPLSVCVKVNSAFYNYKSGVFSDSTCTCTSSNCPINHAVVNVGYGTYPRGGDYWIIRNSWGAGWGNQGYMLIKRGVNMCGIEKIVYRVSAA